jgi:hypothetical protein
VVGYLLLVISASGYCGSPKDLTLLYINETGMPFPELLDKISASTGYRIELVGEWPTTEVNAKMQGVTLEAGLKHIIREMGSISYALVFDSGEKKIRIIRVQEGRESDTPAIRVSTPPAGKNPANSKTAVQQEDETVSPPSPTGEPGLTASQLAVIKAEYTKQQRDQTGDAEISPPSEYGVGLTATELSRIKALHESRSKSQVPDSIIAPSSRYGPGLTLGELHSIKIRHEAMPLSNATLVAPPSKYGPGLTIGEVAAIKAGEFRQPRN